MKNPFNTSVPNVKINDETTVNVLLDVMVRIKRIQADNVLSIDTQYELSNLRTFISSYRFHVKDKIRQTIKVRKELGLPIN